MTVTALPELQALRALTPDGRLLFGTRLIRLFAYGALSIVLALYLAERGLSDSQIGLLLSLTLLGDVIISLLITAIADRVGRRRMLMIGASLLVGAGLVFAISDQLLVLTIAAIIGTISPSGAEVGPFLAIEQAILPQTAPANHRTQIFAWYNLAGSIATALGALSGGLVAQVLQQAGYAAITSYQVVIIGYAFFGIGLLWLFGRLSPHAEALQPSHTHVTTPTRSWIGLHRSRRVVVHLAALFALDAFAGGLVVQSLVAYWFQQRFGVSPAVIGGIFFGANLLAALSALAAARVAARIGLINTMVFTHLPSNILLILVPLMPTLPLAIIVLLARFSISQMDVPTRQSYTMAVVDPDERSAAAGVTTIVRTAASAASPFLTGLLLQAALLSFPFFLAGGLKIIYDLLLYRSFAQRAPALAPPEER
jgi:MFS family permease